MCFHIPHVLLFFAKSLFLATRPSSRPSPNRLFLLTVALSLLNQLNDDDQWIFDPSNDLLMDEYYSNKRPFDDSDDDSQDEVMIGGGATPLLDFQLRPLRAS